MTRRLERPENAVLVSGCEMRETSKSTDAKGRQVLDVCEESPEVPAQASGKAQHPGVDRTDHIHIVRARNRSIAPVVWCHDPSRRVLDDYGLPYGERHWRPLVPKNVSATSHDGEGRADGAEHDADARDKQPPPG
jgi:hypothetical protein